MMSRLDYIDRECIPSLRSSGVRGLRDKKKRKEIKKQRPSCTLKNKSRNLRQTAFAGVTFSIL